MPVPARVNDNTSGFWWTTGFIPLNEVVVTIKISEDLIGSTQFSFQLNCWSPNPTMQEQRTDVAAPLFLTGETSTMTYGELPQGTSNRFLQTFTAAPVFIFSPR